MITLIILITINTKKIYNPKYNLSWIMWLQSQLPFSEKLKASVSKVTAQIRLNATMQM